MDHKFNSILKEALIKAIGDDSPGLVDSLNKDTNLFEVLDSFVIVNILLETEDLLESKFSRYIALADETIFDSSNSPFLKWSAWVDYVEKKHGI